MTYFCWKNLMTMILRLLNFMTSKLLVLTSGSKDLIKPIHLSLEVIITCSLGLMVLLLEKSMAI